MSKFNFKGMLQGIGMKITQARPEIMLVSGILSVLGGTILACTKTEKAKKAVKDTKEQVQKVEQNLNVDEDGLAPETIKQLKIERGRNYVKIYSHTAYEFIKLYGIPALFWLGGMGMICGGHGELRRLNKGLTADILASGQLFKEYRERVAKAVGEEVEQKIFMGAQEGMVNVLEKDEETGEEKIVQKQADIFYAQPGSMFARNFTPETSDEFDIRYFAENIIDSRVDQINKHLELGLVRAYNGMDILRQLGFNENALGEDESVDQLLKYGISGNARKVPDPEMRKLKVTKLRGYQKRWDEVHKCEIYVECLRLDFNFYPLEGKI